MMEMEDIGAFPAEILAVTGSRKIACIVSCIILAVMSVMKLAQVSTSNRIRIYDVDVDINDDEDL